MLDAQTAVTGIDYGDWSTTGSSYDSSTGLTFLNYNREVTSVSTGSGDYSFNGPVAEQVYFRRDDGNGEDNSSVFYQYINSYNSSSVIGEDFSSLDDVMLSNNLTMGLRNPFANGNSSTEGNIERIDFYFGGSYTVTGSEAFVFFDLENAGNFGDGFRISAFEGWRKNKPKDYANTGVLVQPGTYGPALDSPYAGTDGDFLRASYSDGDNLTGNASVAGLQADLNLVGIIITMADLGLQAGDTIKGFSLMAGDVAPTDAHSLEDWKNSSVYKDDTDGSTWGNVDFMAFGAQLANPVPEPATFGALMVGGLAALTLTRRRRRLIRA